MANLPNSDEIIKHLNGRGFQVKDWYDHPTGGAAPWVEFQPGMFNRRIELRCSLPDGEHALVLFDSQDHCQICDKQLWDLTETPVLCDALWDRLFPQNGVVCLPCLEERLGRPLTLEDLILAPWNKDWLQRNRLKAPPQKET